jgi:hypothetical protein
MPDFDEIRDVKARFRQRLLAIPGVHCVAIGPKLVAGQLTAEPVIVVFVTKKKPLAEISPEEVIPPEIEGIKTDVVEEELPQLLAGGFPDEQQYPVLAGGIQIQAGNTLSGKGTLGCIAKTNDPNPKVVAITNQHVVTAWGEKDIGLTVYVSPDGQQVLIYGSNLPGTRIEYSVEVTPPGGNAQQLGPLITTNTDTPVTIASQLATAITAAATPNATAQATQVSVHNKPGPAGNLTIQSAPGFTAQMTCRAQIMWIDTTSTKVITLQGNNAAGLIVVARIIVIPPTGDFQYLDIFYRTVASDTLTSIANEIAARINGLANPGVTAAGPSAPNGTEVTITSGPNFAANFDPTKPYLTRVYYPEAEDPDAKLNADIADNVINFTGKISGDNYGVYPNVNTGGQPPTVGYFLQPSNNSDAGAVTAQIVQLLKSKNIPNIFPQGSGAQQITITGAEEVECVISSDVRVGQPVNTFPPSCLRCLDRRIGRVLDARLDLDIALVQLDAGLQYKAEVVATPDNWVIAGTHEVTDAEAMPPFAYEVKKRGRSTGVTNGKIQYLHADGDIGTLTVFHRHYTDAIKIVGPSFCDEGDSGSAILNSANEVVGILFAGFGSIAHAIPIQVITDAFKITIESATQVNDVRTVPQLAADQNATEPTVLARAVAAPVIRMGIDWNQLHVAEQELAATRLGGEFLDVVRRHAPEAQKLIVRNRHFAAVWHRSGGTQILQAILRMPQVRHQSLPSAINGKPLIECVRTIQHALYRYGSRELSADLARQLWFIETAANRPYCELLAILQSRTE